MQNTYLVNGLGYDCNRFGNNGVCISAGAQSTSVRTQDNASVGGQIILAYKFNPNVRLGTYIEHSSASQSLGAVKLGSTTPAFGLFAAWNQHADGKGAELKVSTGQVRKNATVTRAVVEDSEAGSGGTNLNSQGVQALFTYAFEVSKDMTISPYAGMRYTQSKMGGYTEATAVGVTAPLAYQAITTYSTTALAGMGAALKLNPQATIHAGVGMETDTNTKNGTHTASSAAIAGLTVIDVNANPQKTRLTASLTANYDLGEKQRISISASSRQEANRSAPTRSVFASYIVGF